MAYYVDQNDASNTGGTRWTDGSNGASPSIGGGMTWDGSSGYLDVETRRGANSGYGGAGNGGADTYGNYVGAGSPPASEYDYVDAGRRRNDTVYPAPAAAPAPTYDSYGGWVPAPPDGGGYGGGYAAPAPAPTYAAPAPTYAAGGDTYAAAPAPAASPFPPNFGGPNTYPTLPMTPIRQMILGNLAKVYGPRVGMFPQMNWRPDMAPMFTGGAFGGVPPAEPMTLTPPPAPVPPPMPVAAMPSAPPAPPQMPPPPPPPPMTPSTYLGRLVGGAPAPAAPPPMTTTAMPLNLVRMLVPNSSVPMPGGGLQFSRAPRG